jgi:hypothetical protein
LYFQIAVISDQELGTHATLAVGYQGSDISKQEAWPRLRRPATFNHQPGCQPLGSGLLIANP